MPYNRYRGNTGRVERVEDRPEPPRPPERYSPEPSSSEPYPPRAPAPAPPPLPRGELIRLLDQLGHIRLETEDLLLLAILYLLYRETKDEEFLIMMAGIVLF